MAERENGCVTNFPKDAPKYTIWKSGNYFMAEEFGIGGGLLSIQGDPVFQDLAQEVHRLACEVGRLRRAEIDAQRGIVPALAGKILESGADQGAARAGAAIADWLDGQAAKKDEAAGLTAGGDWVRRAIFRTEAGALREAAEAVRQGRARREGGA